jgi:glycosyltransferase involved in cell wall biosynthesis
MSAKKRILYLSYDGLTDPLGQSQILPYLEGLSKKGYYITIISFEKPNRFLGGRDILQNRCQDYSITWIPLTYHKSPPILSTIFDLLHLKKIAKREHKKNPISIVHCRSYLTSLVGLWMKNKWNTKFIFDMRGFWADERVEGGLWNLKNPLYRLVYKYFKKKETEFIRQSDYTIVLTESAKSEILSWGFQPKIEVIPCCVELTMFNSDRFDLSKKNNLRSVLGLSADHFVLLYLGSIGTWYQWEAMVSFFKRLKSKRTNAKFLILTPDHDQIESSPDFIVRSISRSEVPLYIYAADASICFIQPSFSKKASSATKMAEVLAMNIPVVVNGGWGDIGFLSDKVNNLLIVDKNEEFIFNKIVAKEIIPQSEFFTNFFSLESGVSKYNSVYQRIIS